MTHLARRLELPARPAEVACLPQRPAVGESRLTEVDHAELLDLANLAGNTADGVHMATAGGVWQALVSGFGGLTWRGGLPHLSPNLPPEWDRLGFAVSIRGSRVKVDVTRDRVTVRLQHGDPVELNIWGSTHTVAEEPTIAIR